MARAKKGNPIHGWLILDKPQGMTSTQAVAAVKSLYNAQKAGHAGTLDPLATGILPIALGEATKTCSFAVDGEKAYRFTVRWGTETSTDDAEGEVIQTSDRRPTAEDIEEILPRFTGEISQVPPTYSAIKINGERAYDLAREGEKPVLEPRPVLIEELRIVERLDESTTVFEAVCGKGTYVRALARDMGREMGCYGHVIALRRTQVGPFGEEVAVPLDELQDASRLDGAIEALKAKLLPVESVLDDLQRISLSSADASRVRSGQNVLIRGRDAPILRGPAYAMAKGQLVAIGELAKGEFRPTRVFNLG
ncbi:MAG TPA: tRNA pseudouridine(55) synthase TruB [Hyphomicrobiaceae bacterium]|jgi:tRNA pseudouridine55 synthase